MQDLRQSKEYSNYIERIGWTVEKLADCNIFIRRLPLLGSIIKIQRPDKIPFEKIDQLAQQYRALFVKIEPLRHGNTEIFRNHGFKKNNSPMLCSKTIQIDLTKPEDEILSEMKKDTRYELRKTKERRLQSIEVKDLSLFRKVWKNSVSRKRWIPPEKTYLQPLKNSFGKNFYCLAVVRYTGISNLLDLLAGSILLRHKNTMFYYFAFSSREGKRLGAPYFLVWEAIKLAKKSGCKIFDFEGIYDSRFPNKSWQGFTHFKKGFGGKEVEFPSPMIKFYNPILKLLSIF